MKILLIGGVAGGATAAARLRRLSESAEIVLFERGEHISYANCGLPYHIGGAIPDRRKLLLQTPQSFHSRFRVDVRTRQEVVAIDREAKEVVVHNHRTGTSYRESYDRLLLSPGAEPIRPAFAGADLPGVFTLRNVTDIDGLRDYLEAAPRRHALVVGGGFIGLEMAENLRERGLDVTLVELAPQVMTPLDFEMAAPIHQHLRSHGIDLRLGQGVAAIAQDELRLKVTFTSGEELTTDLVMLSIGVKPETSLAAQAGLALGASGGIAVNSYMQTSEPTIYAVGDAVEVLHKVAGRSLRIPLAGPANKQARIVANNMLLDEPQEYRGAIGTGIAKVFDLTVGSTGLSERQANALGIACRSTIVHSGSHAGYYPGAQPVSIKVVFDEGGKLLGAQVVGRDGADKRLDLLATILGLGGTVTDLQEIEHAYAPPYSSAKDPVNVAGYVAGNILAGTSRHLPWNAVCASGPAAGYLIDVRTRAEYLQGTIEGAVHIPVDELRDRLAELPKGRTLIVFCGVGQRAFVAERILRQSGFDDVFNLTGGYKTYAEACGRIVRPDLTV